ncbi:hypothetical protein V9T40_002149 [Parthenolecanium corni]|uniref:Uncharacterized protein n=1 Tax=Parthenolecanium corni TaxID=536013 RepID=A0AAN9Y3J5_9HEMI
MNNIIASVEYFDYRPPNSANLNEENGDFCIVIHNEDLVTHPNKSLLELRGKVTLAKDEDGSAVQVIDHSKLVVSTCGWLHLFDRIDYFIGDNKIDTVRKPGITSLMKGLASFETDKQYCDAGWNFDSDEAKNTIDSSGYFQVTIPMSTVIGFFEDHKSYIYNMSQKLVFYKTSNGVLNLFKSVGDYSKVTAKVDLRDVVFKMPHVKFELEHTTRVRSEIAKNCKYELRYRRWFYNNISPASGTDFTWDIPVSYAKTKYILIAFQTRRWNVKTADASRFDLCDLENCQVLLNNNVYYPHERLNVVVSEHRAGVLYSMYKRFKGSYYSKDIDMLQPLLSYTDFITKNPMIVIDCSYQPNVLKESLINLKIFFNWREPLPVNTTIHCVTIVDDKAVYSPLTGYIHQKDVLEYLKNILSVVDTVFVQGSVKEQYISFLMREYPAVNIKNIDQLFLTDSFNRHNNNFTCPYNTKSHKSMYCALERGDGNVLILKEAALTDVVSNYECYMLAKPPCNLNTFTSKTQQSIEYVYAHIHGIPWYAGTMDLNHMEKIIKKVISEAHIVYLDKPYEVGLKSFVTYNNIYNITENNNTLRVIYRAKANDKTIPKNNDNYDEGDEEEEEEEDEEIEDMIDIILLDDNTKTNESKKKLKKERPKRSIPSTSNLGNLVPGVYLDANEGIDPKLLLEGEKKPQKTAAVVNKQSDSLSSKNEQAQRSTSYDDIIIPPGIYEIDDISAYITSKLSGKRKFSLKLNKNTLRIELNSTLTVDFTQDTSIGPTLGFERLAYKRGTTYKSSHLVDIFPINMIRVRCNLVKNNIEDTRLFDNTLYEFPLNVSPGEKIVERPTIPTFYSTFIMNNKKVEEFLRVERELQQKFESMKYGKMFQDITTRNKFAPILEPLADINKKIEPSTSFDTHNVKDNNKDLAAFKHMIEIRSGKSDVHYGIRSENGNFFIGNTRVDIVGDDLIFETGKRYIGTKGLWELLTNTKPHKDNYKESDLNTYGEILVNTYAYKRNNDPDGKVKNIKGSKYSDVIRPIMNIYGLSKGKQGIKEGKGLRKIVTGKDVEYVYWNTIDELLERLYILYGNIMTDYGEQRYTTITTWLLPKPMTGSSNGKEYTTEHPHYPIKEGKGLLSLNSLIDALPVPLHLPGYNYAGPGTPLDLQLEKGVKPVNKLDEAAMHHDISYANHHTLEKRHEADHKLQEDAWKRVIANDSSIGEKANAWLVSNAMKVKRAVGAGLSKTKPKQPSNSKPKYTLHPVNLDECDLKNLQKAMDTGKGLTVTFRYNRTKESAGNELKIPLTAKQIRNIKGKHTNEQDAKVRLYTSQIKEISVKEGGFLPALAAAVPAITAVGTLVTSGINAWNNKKANDKLVEERKRHNKAMESLAGLNKKGEGVYINKKPKGGGVYINKKPKVSGEGVCKSSSKKTVALTNIDIEKIATTINIPYFRGVFMRDRLPAKVRATETGVVNLDKTTGPGTHWVAYRKIGEAIKKFIKCNEDAEQIGYDWISGIDFETFQDSDPSDKSDSKSGSEYEYESE